MRSLTRSRAHSQDEEASGVAVVKVAGAATEVEMIEKKHRIEDALEAVKSAQQEGIVLVVALPALKFVYNNLQAPDETKIRCLVLKSFVMP